MGIQKSLDAILRFLVTCCYIGYLPGASGTYASAAACILVYFFPSVFADIFFCAGLVVFSVICVNLYRYDGTDPKYIVIDELAGMCVALAGHSASLKNIIIAFVLFRLFDILKPVPIRTAERLRGGYGVMADDVIAGIFANIILVIAGLFL
ncbi:MAG TPA: phosphatidylglycerophosphatase A [Syntrophorhabdaceae bacterium]|nr:phosphatidylglycerophosphatase A [Syntrophorhabdaceae bacterium]